VTGAKAGVEAWCERGDSNPHGFTRQILSSPRTGNERVTPLATDYEELLELMMLLPSTAARIAIRGKWQGLVVGTKIGHSGCAEN
jgi:hypothetical protein